MSLIYVIRHSKSVANVDPTIYGTMPNQDIPLGDEGILEAKEAAKRIYDDLSASRYPGALAFAKKELPVALFSSPYKRAIETAKIIGERVRSHKVHQNILLSERQYGNQEGCNKVDDFSARPMERYAYGQAGHLWYKPQRGESLMEVYERVTLFFLLQHRFQFIPVAVISTHLFACQMFHALFTEEMPTSETKWQNGEVRKYQISSETTKYLGIV